MITPNETLAGPSKADAIKHAQPASQQFPIRDPAWERKGEKAHEFCGANSTDGCEEAQSATRIEDVPALGEPGHHRRFGKRYLLLRSQRTA
jgi:hypothetical protein